MASRLLVCMWLLLFDSALAAQVRISSQNLNSREGRHLQQASSKVTALSEAPDSKSLDISLTGACRADIRYHCTHVLTDNQLQALRQAHAIDSGAIIEAQSSGHQDSSAAQSTANQGAILETRPKLPESTTPSAAIAAAAALAANPASKVNDTLVNEIKKHLAHLAQQSANATAAKAAAAAAAAALAALESNSSTRSASDPAASSSAVATATDQPLVTSQLTNSTETTAATAETTSEPEVGAKDTADSQLSTDAVGLDANAVSEEASSKAYDTTVDTSTSTTAGTALTQSQPAAGATAKNEDTVTDLAAQENPGSEVLVGADVGVNTVGVTSGTTVQAAQLQDTASAATATNSSALPAAAAAAAAANGTSAATVATNDTATATTAAPNMTLATGAGIAGSSTQQANGTATTNTTATTRRRTRRHLLLETGGTATTTAPGSTSGATTASAPNGITGVEATSATTESKAIETGGSTAVDPAGSQGSSTRFVSQEINHVSQEQPDLQVLLERFGMNPSMPATALQAANAPIARCLKMVLHQSQLSIAPDAPDLSDECKADVRTFLIRRASDIRLDPPLLATCAHDIVQFCYDTDDPTMVYNCLKRHKRRLHTLCKVAVTQRQAAAAEDLSLDPDMQRNCAADRQKFCGNVGWGEGAAQSCLEEYLVVKGTPLEDLSGYYEDMGLLKRLEEGDAEADEADRHQLSSGCRTALFQRKMEMSEDVRLNYPLASACVLDKQTYCRDVKPGDAAVLLCLEHHMDEVEMTDACYQALEENRLYRAIDARLDHPFMAHCGEDVRSLCKPEVYEAAAADAAAAPIGAGNAALECLRQQLELVRAPQCKSHVYHMIVHAFRDNRLDGVLMANCSTPIRHFCSAPSQALDCLKEKIRDDFGGTGKFSEQQPISDTCVALVNDRLQQAAGDVAFNPALMEACATERDHFCPSDLEGVKVLDCLSDHRNAPEFSDRCHGALTLYLMGAVRDIRTMAGLRTDCAEDVKTLCSGIVPGEGRVIACLREQRANITGELCKRQVLRLLGFLVEDHRLDYTLMRACKADVQQYCAGVEPGDGLVHDCLRRSREHLSPECLKAESDVEKMEHEDVRLNPKIQKECPLAISQFCREVQPGNANVLACLQGAMNKGHFPSGCKAVLVKLLDRSSVKYSLNTRLIDACQDDVDDICAFAPDEPDRPQDDSVLACLSRSVTELSPDCRSELTSLVRLSLTRYRMGMPLTSPCDGDVLARCAVDKLSAPFIEQGYVQQCLIKHATKVHPPCWALISTMDDTQFHHAVEMEEHHWQGSVDDEAIKEVAAELRRELEPKLMHHMAHQVNHSMSEVVSQQVTEQVTEQVTAHHRALRPTIDALLHSTVALLVLVLVVVAVAVHQYRKRGGNGGTMIFKDGRV